MCDCYSGCWGHHAKELNWNSIKIPQHLIDKHQGKHYPIMAAAMDIVKSEGIPYGDYVLIDTLLYVNPNFRPGTKGFLA